MTIRKYENMKRPIITAVLATVALLTAEAQSVTYNHDDAVMNQVTVQETGSGSLTPDLYYDVFHKSYRNSASETNKLSYRTMTAAYMKLQEPYSEKIDSDLVKRAKVEAANLLDRRLMPSGLWRKVRSTVPLTVSGSISRRLPLSVAAIRTMKAGRKSMT